MLKQYRGVFITIGLAVAAAAWAIIVPAQRDGAMIVAGISILAAANTAFLTWPGASPADEDGATLALLDKTTGRGRVMVTGCSAHGRTLGRVCVLSFRTHQPQIDALIEDMAAAIEDIRTHG